MVATAELLADLGAERDVLDALVAGLTPADWARATPAEGWTVADQIGHLAWTDEAALIAVEEPERFAAEIVPQALATPTAIDDGAAAYGARPDLLATWRRGSRMLATALAGARDGVRLPWFGPPMSVPSMATARLMETWAHGQDVADALGVVRPATDRLRHVAHIGVRTRDFAYVVRGMAVPAAPFRVELTGPAGDRWEWGPADAAQRVTGPALDFCLLVTRRRHRADLALSATGDEAGAWLDVAQAFAGPPGAGRPQDSASHPPPDRPA